MLRIEWSLNPAQRFKMKYSVFTIAAFFIAVSLGYGEMYKWMDEMGTIHFADDLSHVPEKYRPDVEMRKTLKEIPPSEDREKRVVPPTVSGEEGFLRRSPQELERLGLHRNNGVME